VLALERRYPYRYARAGIGSFHESAPVAGMGSRCVTNAWADPACGVVFVYLTNRLEPGDLGVRHQCQVSDTIRRACMENSHRSQQGPGRA